MSMLASFEGTSEFAVLAAFLFLTWVTSAVLLLVTLVLAFARKTRRVSKRCAIACMVAAVPVSLFDASLLFRSVGPGDPVAGWPFLLATLAPLVVAAGVLWFDHESLRKENRLAPSA